LLRIARRQQIATMKAIYRNTKSGDIFAIETDKAGEIVKTSGPLFAAGFDPNSLDYDEYWNEDVKARLPEFELVTKADYDALLRQNGFIRGSSQPHLF
jgi:hypothetical protein